MKVSLISRHLFALATSLLLTASAQAQFTRIKGNQFGINVERDEFFGHLYLKPQSQGGDPVVEAANRANMESWLADIGAGFVRVNVPNDAAGALWEEISWKEANDLTARKTVNGVPTIQVCLFWGTGTFSPTWTTTQQNTYLARVGSLVAANPLIDWFELGNEVDIDMATGQYTPAQYAYWLKKMSAVIRANNPDAKIIMASMAGSPENNNFSLPSHFYFKKILEQGCGGNLSGTGYPGVDGKPIVDFYSFHFYWNNTYGDHGSTLAEFLTAMKSRIDSTPGAARRPMVMSELGYGLTSGGQFYAETGATEHKQNRFITQKLIGHYANEVAKIYPIERVDNFILRDYANEPYGFGLMYNSGGSVVKRAQYYGYKNTVSKLKGSVPFNKRTFTNTGGVCYEYMKANGQKLSVLWHPTPEAAGVSNNLAMGCTTVSIQDSAGNLVSGNPAFANGIQNIGYSSYQRWVVGGNAHTWKEGEAFTSKTGTFTTSTVSDQESYNGSHITMTGSGTADRRLNYSMSVPRAGDYTVWVAATPPNNAAYSRYKFNLISGPSAPTTGWKYSHAQGTTTGCSYGADRTLNWIRIGDFTLASGACWFSIQPIDALPFSIDAVYVEPKQPTQ